MIWNLGVMLHWMIFKKLPYETKNKNELLSKMYKFRATVK